jgi:hypothetical protein
MTRADIERMLEAVDVHGRGLTEWEDKFMTSIHRQFEQKGVLSARQCEILERIYEEKISTGTSFQGKKFTSEPVTELPSERLRNKSRRYD